MKKKSVTRVLDLSLVVLMLITMGTMFTGIMVEFHSMFGMVFILLLTLHVISKWSWIKGVAKRIKTAPKAIKVKFYVAIALMIAWYSTAILAIAGGLLGIPELFMAHSMFAMVAIVITIIHLIQHSKRIKALANND